MADFLNYTSEDRKKIAQGLLPLVPGAPEGAADALAGMSDDGVNAQISFAKQLVDGNVAPPAKKRGLLAMLRGDEAEPQEDGARDKLRKLVDRERTGDKLTDPKQVQTLESALAAAGYKVGLNGAIFDQERGYLDTFYNQLGSGMTLNSIFAANTEIYQAEADAAAQAEVQAAAAEAKAAAEAISRADLQKQYEAGLVYSGYLDAKDVGNPAAAAEALSDMVSNTSRSNTPADELRSMFVDTNTMEPNAKALDFIREHSLANNTSVRLENDLESGEPAQVERAQAYMRLNGVQVEGQDVQINGLIYSQDFKTVAQDMIRQPITAPEGTGPGGTLNIREIYSVTERDQLYVSEAMMEALSPGEREAAMMYPEAKDALDGGMTREGFVAARLLAEDPAKYNALLAADNAARAGATLDVEIELPTVAVPPDATLEEERVEIAQNPAGLQDVKPEEVVLDSAEPIAAAIQAEGTGVTDRSGYVVFDNQNIPLNAVMDAVVQDGGLSGDGNADNTVSMQGAMLIVAQFTGGDVSNPATLANDAAEVMGFLHNSGFIEGKDNLPGKPQFDLTNPADRQAVMQGLVTYADLKSTQTLDGMTQGLTLEGASTLGREDVAAAIRAASGFDGVQPQTVPAAPAPAPTDPAEKGFLAGTFERFGIGAAEAATPANIPEAPSAARPQEKLVITAP